MQPQLQDVMSLPGVVLRAITSNNPRTFDLKNTCLRSHETYGYDLAAPLILDCVTSYLSRRISAA